MTEAAARRDLVRYSRQMHAAGWVANHDGNLSARVTDERIVCTPTSFSKLDVGLDDLVVVDRAGTKIAGSQRPFSELVLHRAVYDRRPDVQAVVHAHPPFATAFGVAGRPLPHPFLPEAVVSLGADIPTVPLTAPGGPGAEALIPFVRRCDAVLIAGNGVLTWGPTLELAYLRCELVEHLCRVAHAALPLGGPARLPDALIADLVAKRAKAGLAAPEEGGGATPDPVQRAAAKAIAGIPGADPALVRKLTEQIARQLGG
ncbi:MAG: class II aldolase/adducin family protein [Myxococcales bacterium]|nr:class II aldolase/adducin family protein [Myxococcales bacterium]